MYLQHCMQTFSSYFWDISWKNLIFFVKFIILRTVTDDRDSGSYLRQASKILKNFYLFKIRKETSNFCSLGRVSKSMSEKDFWADFLRVDSIREIELNLSLEDFILLEFMVDLRFISLKKEMEFLLDII